MQINPYIFFDGDCRQAFEFYAKVLGGRIEAMLTHEETPAGSNVGADWQDKIIHARLAIGDWFIMASDSPPDLGPVKPSGFYVQLDFPTPEEAERVFNAFAEGGEVRMPFGPTFWARRFGMLVDRFQIPWMVNCT
jgi:PhnB protein